MLGRSKIKAPKSQDLLGSGLKLYLEVRFFIDKSYKKYKFKQPLKLTESHKHRFFFLF